MAAAVLPIVSQPLSSASPGELDQGFGTDGVVVSDTTPGTRSIIARVAQADSGALWSVETALEAVPGGSSFGDLRLVRHTESGTRVGTLELDSLLPGAPPGAARMTALRSLVSDGEHAYVLVLTWISEPDPLCAECPGTRSDHRNLLMRIGPDLTPDPGFGDGGVLDLRSASPASPGVPPADTPAFFLPLLQTGFDSYLAQVGGNVGDGDLVVDSSGGLLVTAILWGESFASGLYVERAIVRLTSSGQLDSAYGDGGVARTGVDGRDTRVGLAAGPNGTTVAASRSRLVRLLGDGAVDDAFGIDGVVDLGEVVDVPDQRRSCTGGMFNCPLSVAPDGTVVLHMSTHLGQGGPPQAHLQPHETWPSFQNQQHQLVAVSPDGSSEASVGLNCWVWIWCEQASENQPVNSLAAIETSAGPFVAIARGGVLETLPLPLPVPPSAAQQYPPLRVPAPTLIPIRAQHVVPIGDGSVLVGGQRCLSEGQVNDRDGTACQPSLGSLRADSEFSAALAKVEPRTDVLVEQPPTITINPPGGTFEVGSEVVLDLGCADDTQVSFCEVDAYDYLNDEVLDLSSGDLLDTSRPASIGIRIYAQDWLAQTTEQMRFFEIVPAPGTSGTTDDGGSLSTGTAPSMDDPLTSSVVTPSGGFVQLVEGLTGGPAPDGYSLFDQQVVVTAPDQTVEDPLVLTFALAGSVLGGAAPADVEVFRNSVVVADCAGGVAATSAVPDPCVRERESLPDGAVRVSVLSSRASTWTFGVQDAPSGPRVSVGDQSGLERDVVTGSVFVPVTLSEPVDEPVVVSFHTEGGSATSGVDFSRWGTPASPRSVTIPAGALQTTINVPVLADGLVEGEESFSVVVSSVSGGGAVVGDGNASATIVDADAISGGNPAVTVSSGSIVEGDDGRRRLQFQVHLSRAPSSGVTVTYRTVDGSAVAPGDFVAKLPGSVVFAPGQISKTVDVLVNPDTIENGDRALSLEVSVTGGSPVEELNMVGVARIIDDD